MSERKALFFVVLSALLWSTSFPAVKVGLGYLNPLWFIFFRFFTGTFIYLFLFYVLKMKFDLSVFREKKIYILSILVFLSYVLQFYGQKFTLASRTALIINLYILWVPFLARYVLDERVTKSLGLAILLALSGMVLLVTKGDFKIFMYSRIFIGDIIVFIASLTWAFYIVLGKDLLKKYNVHEFNIVTFGFTALLSIPFLFFVPLTLPQNTISILVIIHLALFCTVLAYFFYTMGLKHAGAIKTSIFVVLEVFFTFLISWLFLNETWNKIELAGGILVIISIVLVLRES